MKKFLVLLALFIMVPALANAWTLATTVSGKGSVEVTGLYTDNPDTVVVEGPRVLNTITARTGYAYPANGVDVSAKIVAAGGYVIQSVSLDGGADIKATMVGDDLLISYAEGTARQNLYVEFALAGGGGGVADKFSATVTQGPNMTVTVKRILPTVSQSSYNTLSGLGYGDVVQVKAQPKAGFQVTGVAVADKNAEGLDFNETRTPVEPLEAGVPFIFTHTIDSNATFAVSEASAELVHDISVSISGPLNALTGTASVYTAKVVTNNAPATFEFFVDGVSKGTANPFSFTPSAAGPFEVYVVATAADGVTDATSATIYGTAADGTANANGICIGCHSKSTPGVLADYDAGSAQIWSDLRSNCVDCHSSAPHTYLDQINTAFAGSPHDVPEAGCAGCHTSHEIDRPNVATCNACHSDVVAEWETTYHANSETTTIAPNGNGGTPYYVYYRGESSSCQSCHFPDSQDVYDTPGTTNNNTVGGNYGAVGCAACHGDVIHTTPAQFSIIGKCGECHDRAGHHGQPDPSQTEKVANSKHADGRGHDSSAKCQRCHTTEGSIEFAAYNGDKNVLAGLDSVTALTDVQGPTCAACHDPHTQTLRVVEGWDPNNNGEADQFDLCTSCHTYYDEEGLLVGGGSTSGDFAGTTEEFYHNTSWYRTITTTHYDNPATGYNQTTNAIEGYVIRTEGDNPCFDCHGHELRTNTRRSNDPVDPTDADYGPTIHTDWANSRHGGELLKAKFAAAAGASSGNVETDEVLNAGRVDGEGHGWSWTHYDWDAANRTACQRCHTSTGAENFFSDPENYVAANNDFSHMQAGQNEMLYCWGCHVSAETGELRDTGALTLDYTNNAQASYPDSAGSNICIACHSGRETGDSIKNDPDADGVRSFLNSHYLTAGGVLFAKGGYEYASLNYEIAAGDRHQNVGFGAATPTGDANFDAVSDNYTNGPCVTCHFDSADGSHTLSPFSETETDGTVLNSVCVVCHTSRGVGDSANTWFGKDFEEADFVAGVQGPHKARMLGAQLALEQVLEDKGIYTNYSKYPYFFADAAFTTNFTNWASVYGFSEWKNVMGAAFNANLIAHDPGATAHNRRYARRLLYDSIDFMDDGIMNNSTNATVTAQAQPFTASALGYIGSRP